jgi:CheY-like chemotaxis protein
VFVAHGGRAALADLSRIRPDIALLDIAMPDMSGYELARQIRSRAGPAMRIVALTGFVLDEDRARALEAGFDQHMVEARRPRVPQESARLGQNTSIPSITPNTSTIRNTTRAMKNSTFASVRVVEATPVKPK